MDLTNTEWAAIAPLFPVHPWKKKHTGRPRRPDRDVLNGILWVLRTGAQWKEMPNRYPPYQTCHRRFQEWVKMRLFQKILRALAKELVKEGKMTLDEWFMDGTFASAKKGGLA
jgi:transposase